MCSFLRISALKENEKTKGGAVEKLKRISLRRTNSKFLQGILNLLLLP